MRSTANSWPGHGVSREVAASLTAARTAAHAASRPLAAACHSGLGALSPAASLHTELSGSCVRSLQRAVRRSLHICCAH